MKKISLIVFFTIFTLQNCFADQLQVLTFERANKAASFIKNKTNVILFCGCCDNIPKRLIQVTGTSVKPADIKINGVSQYSILLSGIDLNTNEVINEIIDLAYVYIKVNSSSITVGKFLNYKCDPCIENFDWDFNANPNDTELSKIESNPQIHFKNSLESNEYSLVSLLVQHQPVLEDYKLIFKDDFYKIAYNAFDKLFYNLIPEKFNNTDFQNQKKFKITVFNTNDVINNNCDVCPGALKKIAPKMKPNVLCYIVKFSKDDSTSGTSFSFFSFLNGRWVYFPIN
ncbi:hypothetical protein [Flavobacterium sp. 5]|uniref:hypothetical protein n=1 Tax=Flavobacterium sp. 5 TaxID=2035199 RepID=UPI000C2C4637|nr:hypothetical protein [Flavobacterium sp. 5]PKB18358.1 hypothetical protein CLU82_3633 [Flavobacterium sp. 5]